MRRIAGLVAVVAALWLAGVSAAQVENATCSCATARETNGWCPVHDFGYVGGVKVTSRWLYETIDAHGHHVDLTTYTCPSCRAAIDTSGFCETHRVGFVNKLAYYSRLTYELGRGEAKPRSSIACAACRKNSDSFGWCSKSGVGMVGLVAIKNRQDFDHAVAALKIFMAANAIADTCNYCAGAIITDSECPMHKIRYKDGKAIARAVS